MQHRWALSMLVNIICTAYVCSQPLTSLPMYSTPHERNSLHCTFQSQHSVWNVTCASAPFCTHSCCVSTGKSYERLAYGVALMYMAGGRNLCSKCGRREVVR